MKLLTFQKVPNKSQTRKSICLELRNGGSEARSSSIRTQRYKKELKFANISSIFFKKSIKMMKFKKNAQRKQCAEGEEKREQQYQPMTRLTKKAIYIIRNKVRKNAKEGDGEKGQDVRFLLGIRGKNATESIYIHSIYIVRAYICKKAGNIIWLSYGYYKGIIW